MTTKTNPAKTTAANTAHKAARGAKKAAAAQEAADLKAFKEKLDARTPEDWKREAAEWAETEARGLKSNLYLSMLNDPDGLTVVRDIVGKLTRDTADDLTDYAKVRPNLLAALMIVEGVEQVRDYSQTQAM